MEHIKPEIVDPGNHMQWGRSCVLTAYTLAAVSITKRPINEYFEGYFKQFQLEYIAKDYGMVYDGHFHDHIRTMGLNGHRMVQMLHNCSDKQPFVLSRIMFNVDYINKSAKKAEEIVLRLKLGAMVSLSLKKEGPEDAHSMLFGFGGDNFWGIETTQNKYFDKRKKHPRFKEEEFRKILDNTYREGLVCGDALVICEA